MDTKTLQQQGKAAISQQKLKDEATILRGLIYAVDLFVETLVDRLQNPNEQKLLGISKGDKSSAPLAEKDTEFLKCKQVFKSQIGNVLAYRAEFGSVMPPQYKTLQSILDLTTGVSIPTDKYPYEYEFLYRMSLLMSYLNDVQKIDNAKSQDPTNCLKYGRMKKLIVGKTADDKYKFNFNGLSTQLRSFVTKYDKAVEKKEVNDIIDYVSEVVLLEEKVNMPYVPGTEVDLDALRSKLQSAVVSSQTGLAQVPVATKTGEQTSAELRARLEKLKNGGRRRKTHRNKKAQRKSRKHRKM